MRERQKVERYYLPLASIVHAMTRQSEPMYVLTGVDPHSLLPSAAIGMERAITNWFINDDITITDFDVVQT